MTDEQFRQLIVALGRIADAIETLVQQGGLKPEI
jgi:hypothetical protein